jgi:hypothetical protein
VINILKGKVLKLKTGLIVVPFEYEAITCRCVVVKGNNNYEAGGYNICISYEDLENAEIINME